MRYIRVHWKHQNLASPTTLYSELDAAGWELRKVEVFSDGRIGYADGSEAAGDTRLSTEPLPTLAEIGADPQFEPYEISNEEFERVWASAH